MKKRIWAALLTLCMVLTLLPTAALAADGDTCADGDACTHAAAIGDKHYGTLAAAVAAAQGGETIKLLEDVEESGIKIAKDTFTSGTLVLDLNEHTYTATSMLEFGEGNHVTLKNGTILGDFVLLAEASGYAEGLLDNWCAELTLDKVTLDGSKLTIAAEEASLISELPTMYNNAGVTVIKNSSVVRGIVGGGTIQNTCSDKATANRSVHNYVRTAILNSTVDGIINIFCMCDSKPTVPEGSVTADAVMNGTYKDFDNALIVGTITDETAWKSDTDNLSVYFRPSTGTSSSANYVQKADGTLDRVEGDYYTVTFDPNGGTMEKTQYFVPTTKNNDDTLNAAELKLSELGSDYTPTYAGNTLVGWTKTDAGSNSSTNVEKNATLTLTSDIKLTARWTDKPITVTFNGNGGKINDDGGNQVDSLSKDYAKGDQYGTLPTATRDGCTFKEWNTAITGAASTLYTNSTINSDDDYTVYAIWNVTVSFDLNYENAPAAPVDRTVIVGNPYKYGDQEELPTPANRDGFTFDGWYTAANGGTKVTGSTEVTTANNHTLYAHWTPNSPDAGTAIAVQFNTVKTDGNNQIVKVKDGVEYEGFVAKLGTLNTQVTLDTNKTYDSTSTGDEKTVFDAVIAELGNWTETSNVGLKSDVTDWWLSYDNGGWLLRGALTVYRVKYCDAEGNLLTDFKGNKNATYYLSSVTNASLYSNETPTATDTTKEFKYWADSNGTKVETVDFSNKDDVKVYAVFGDKEVTPNLTITKTVTGIDEDLYKAQTFTFKVLTATGTPVGQDITITGAGSASLYLTPGTYYVMEVPALISGCSVQTTYKVGDGIETTIPTSITVVDNAVTTVTVNNAYTPDSGVCKISYQFTGDAPGAAPQDATLYQQSDTVTLLTVSSVTGTKSGVSGTWTFNGWTVRNNDGEVVPVEGGKFEINGDVTATGTWTFTPNTTPSGGNDDDDDDNYYFAIKKVDAQDGKALNGAVFELYQLNDKGQKINGCRSNRSGAQGSEKGGIAYFSVDRLTKNDTWYYTEVTAPQGYALDDTVYKISSDDFSETISAAVRNAEVVTNDRTTTPAKLNSRDHYAYVIGYQDGLVRPYGLISRAEVTTIFFRLLTEEWRDGNLRYTNDYADVSKNYWANTAISTMSGLGIVQGFSNGNFDPTAPITRAQFAAICARFDTKQTSSAQSSFTDTKGHWAEKYIQRAAELGWVQGFEDGTFRPDTYITRAQAMTMINRVLNRIPEDADDLLDDMSVWPDCNPGDWYYLAVQEATNSHDFKKKSGNYERWTDMNTNPDWTRYEN